MSDPTRSEMPEFSLEVLRAEHGDCLLLRHGSELVLIDGGPADVYDHSLKPRLQQLMTERGLPLWIRMVMVSHIDDDHIVGLADMFADARERKEEHRGAEEWRAGELWFNAFGALTGPAKAESAGGPETAAVQALVAAAPGHESWAIAASVPNGVALQQDAEALAVKRNKTFGGELVRRGADYSAIEVVPGLTFTVLAPTDAELQKLQVKWVDWVQAHTPRDAEKAANLDRSVFNLSSIVVLARSGERTVLLTGDARSDDIVQGLEGAGLLRPDGPPFAVDILKVPHHGSIRNVDKAFFARVHARHYVISANGRDGNPKDATLSLICDARRDRAPWTLWLTYGGQDGDGKPGLHRRLVTFLSGRRAAGQEVDVRFAAPGGWHTITA